MKVIVDKKIKRYTSKDCNVFVFDFLKNFPRPSKHHSMLYRLVRSVSLNLAVERICADFFETYFRSIRSFQLDRMYNFSCLAGTAKI
jgi:hypothetical protein